MAYNVLKGSVDGSVDQHADQEISGVKVFKNTISASVFYDTDAQSPCATMKDVPINKIIGGSKHSLLTWDSEGTVRSNHAITFNGEVLETRKVKAHSITADGAGLTNLPPDRFSGKISAADLHLGNGLKNLRDNLQIDAGPGLTMDDEGLKVSVARTGGISFNGGRLSIDPNAALSITDRGQNLSDNDLLLVADISRGTVTKTTLSNFYDNYVKLKTPQPAGDVGEIQIKTRTGFGSSAALSYDSQNSILNVRGRVQATDLRVLGALNCVGSVVKSIKNTTERAYVVQHDDYTIVCDTNSNPIDIMLPPASDHKGRILNFKKANTDKYNLKSYPVTLRVQEGTIDRHPELVIKNNYGLRCLQSDGSNWWVVGAHSS